MIMGRTLREYIKELEKRAPDKMETTNYLVLAKSDGTHSTGISGHPTDIMEMFHYIALHVLEGVKSNDGEVDEDEAIDMMEVALRFALEEAVNEVKGNNNGMSETLKDILAKINLDEVN